MLNGRFFNTLAKPQHYLSTDGLMEAMLNPRHFFPMMESLTCSSLSGSDVSLVTTMIRVNALLGVFLSDL